HVRGVVFLEHPEIDRNKLTGLDFEIEWRTVSNRRIWTHRHARTVIPIPARGKLPLLDLPVHEVRNVDLADAGTDEPLRCLPNPLGRSDRSLDARKFSRRLPATNFGRNWIRRAHTLPK